MNKELFKKILPHLIAVLVFIIVAVIYCKPALEGKVLSQHDITHWKGSIHQSQIYNETHGHYPLWTNALFSGMPTFQIGGLTGNYLAGYFHTIITLGLPKPIQFFFLACICFYFLCVVMGVRPWIGIMGALAFAYATYNAVIIVVGHDTKMLSIAYMPGLLASIMLIYERRYWPGIALSGMFASAMIAMNHPQIAYYFFVAAGIMTIFYAVRWIRNKDYKHLIKALMFTGGAAIIGVLTNAVVLFSTYEYQKQTIRGGSSALTDSTKKIKSETGLDKDYAFSYSMNITEPFVLMVPRIYGGSSDKEEVSQDKSKAVEALTLLPKQLQQQLPLTYYWGGMTKPGEVGTSGPPYVGAIICFLAIFGMFVLENKHKWWILTAVGLTIMMSWGGYFEGFNTILYKYLPFYNKFRAPSMILVIPQLLLPLLAVLCVDRITKEKDKKALLPWFKKGMIATAVIFLMLFLLYLTFEFLSTSDKEILKQVREMNNPQLLQAVDSFFDGLKADRKSLMLGDIFRSLGFIAVAGLLLFLLLRNIIKPLIVIISLAILLLIDVMAIDVKYLNSDSYVDMVENEGVFLQTKTDKEILADKSFFRVYNVSGNAFSENITSYYYNSVGGYHAAKLIIYQDLIERQLSKDNQKVLDMLNTKYLIQKDQNGQTKASQTRGSALGPVWFVQTISYVKNADEEMAALNYFNPKNTAIVQESFMASIPFTPQPDSASTIRLLKNDNDIINYTSEAAANQFAVFSEIYYDAGWRAFIDGKESPIVKVNYVLRGLSVPAGKHTIEFRFEPSGYLKGKKLTSIFSILLLLLLVISIFMEWRKYKSLQLPNRA